MIFLNPIEILNLQNLEVSSIDSSIIKKSKRLLFADIDLSDDQHLNYKGLSISKSDCEKVINELESKDKIEFYHFIANYSDLNNFLITGDEKLFSSFRYESIYKLPEFINFISPYFSERFDRILYKSYRKNDIELLKKMLSVKPPVKDSEYEKLYKSLSSAIKENILEIDKQTNDIKNEQSNYDENDIEDVLDWVQQKLDAGKINLLPNYFQSLRNQCSNSIRNLSVYVFSSCLNFIYLPIILRNFLFG